LGGEPRVGLNHHMLFAASQGALHAAADVIGDAVGEGTNVWCTPFLADLCRFFFPPRWDRFGWVYATSVRRSHQARHLETRGLHIEQSRLRDLTEQMPVSDLDRLRRSAPLRLLPGLVLPPEVTRHLNLAASPAAAGGEPVVMQARAPRRLALADGCPVRGYYEEVWTAVVRRGTSEEQLFRGGWIPAAPPSSYLAGGIRPVPIVNYQRAECCGYLTTLAVEFSPEEADDGPAGTVLSFRASHKESVLEQVSVPAQRDLLGKALAGCA
jgi:hypothetical protein